VRRGGSAAVRAEGVDHPHARIVKPPVVAVEDLARCRKVARTLGRR